MEQLNFLVLQDAPTAFMSSRPTALVVDCNCPVAVTVLPIWAAFLWLVLAVLISFGIFSYRVRVKVIHDYPAPRQSRRHWSAWHFKHYDRFLDKRVRYARHAQAIDET
jgi:hypothetical protein